MEWLAGKAEPEARPDLRNTSVRARRIEDCSDRLYPAPISKVHGFVGFTPSSDVLAGLTTGAEPRLRINGGIPVAGELGPVKLGDREISSSGDGAVDLTAGAVVDSVQQKVVLATAALVSVPEPSATLVPNFGALALGLLQRRRNSIRPCS